MWDITGNYLPKNLVATNDTCVNWRVNSSENSSLVLYLKLYQHWKYKSFTIALLLAAKHVTYLPPISLAITTKKVYHKPDK